MRQAQQLAATHNRSDLLLLERNVVYYNIVTQLNYPKNEAPIDSKKTLS
jgi:hypothetical protein